MELKSKSNDLHLIKEHAREYFGREYLHFDHGFMTYSVSIDDKSVTVHDIFVIGYKRRKGLALEYCMSLENTVKEYGINKSFGMVQKVNPNADGSRKLLEMYGMTLYTEDEDTEFYVKEF